LLVMRAVGKGLKKLLGVRLDTLTAPVDRSRR
jgi:hypothetical protein